MKRHLILLTLIACLITAGLTCLRTSRARSAGYGPTPGRSTSGTTKRGSNDAEPGAQSTMPLALAAGDFDEDGISDLVSGSATPEGGLVTLWRGNADVIYPHSADAQQHMAQGTFVAAAFLPNAKSFATSVAPEWLAAGDFDADGHCDLVFADRESGALFLLAGDGHGEFGAPLQMSLPGRVTSLAVGEINRADGLDDIVVGVNSDDGPQALIFESPIGARNATPEVFKLPAAAECLALGRLTNGALFDLAIAAGNELVLVHGRDRRLSLDETARAAVPAAQVDRQSFPFNFNALAVGDFFGEHRSDLALLSADGKVDVLRYEEVKTRGPARTNLWQVSGERQISGGARALIPARMSGQLQTDLVVLEQSSGALLLLTSTPPVASQDAAASVLSVAATQQSEPAVAALAVRFNADAVDDLAMLSAGDSTPRLLQSSAGSTYVVNSTSDSGDANTSDGVCDAGGGNCTLRAAIQQANAHVGADTITFEIGSGPQTITPATALPTVTDPLTIDGTTQPGFTGAPIIELKRGGAAGTIDGLTISAGNSVVRGLVINNFSAGVALHYGIVLKTNGHNLIEGNYIGTDVSGSVAVPNGQAISINSELNLIGGTSTAARNLISGNSGGGISMTAGSPFTPLDGNIVEGNYIGTTADGTHTLNNGSNQTGILVTSSNNRIGDVVPGARNIIAGYGQGVQIQRSNAPADANLVQGNYIGTDVTGTIDLGNGTGVFILSVAVNALVGGTTAAARNIISGNSTGVSISNAPNNLVQGNFIGTMADGVTALANSQKGVAFANGSNDTVIGGTSAGAGNVISGNNVGVLIGGGPSGATEPNTAVQGNLIGTDKTGTVAVPNTNEGISAAQPGALIGGSAPGARNVISGNRGSGILINGAGFVVQGNFIGIQIDGVSPLGNNADGINVASNGNNIGGAGESEGNVVAFNTRAGVLVSGLNNSIRRNSIFSNTGLGIDLVPGNVNANDACDTDTGANNRQNFPVLSAATFNGTSTSISGSLNSTANTQFIVDIYSSDACDPAGNGEGKTYLGSFTVTTDETCNANFTDVTLAGVAPAGPVITATATDPASNTSEFSPCVTAIPGNQPPVASDDAATTDEDVAVTINVLANDRDPDGDALSVSNVTHGTNGAVVINADQTLTYTPAHDFNGADSFSYTTSDGQNHTANANVNVTVNPVNDAPKFTKGTDQTVLEDAGTQTVPGWATNIGAGPVNESGQVLSFILSYDNSTLFSVQPSIDAATGTLSYLPAANANGVAHVTVTLHDNGGTTAGGVDTSVPQDFTITVTPVNDAPTADPQTVTSDEDTSVAIALTGSDVETASTALNFSVTQGPTHGTLTGAAPHLNYRPAADYHGADNFNFTVTDTGDGQAPALTSAAATVSIIINPINDAPAAGNDSYSVDDNGTLGIPAPGVLGNDSDVDGDVLRAVLVSAPTHGALTLNANGSFSYTPSAAYKGPDSFSYQASDGSLSSSVATVVLAVNPVNSAPVAIDGAAAAQEDTSTTATLRATDVDGDILTFMVVSGPTHGTLGGIRNRSCASVSGAAACTALVDYTPGVNFNGTDNFTFRSDDGQAPGNVATITINVSEINDAPHAQDDTKSGLEDTSLIFPSADLLANDNSGPANESGQHLTVTGVGAAKHGTVTLKSGNVIYTPAANFNGTDRFTYAVTDDGTTNGAPDPRTAIGTVHVSVAPVNDAPVANNREAILLNSNTSAAIDLTTLVSDVETSAANLRYNFTTQTSHGVLLGVAPRLTYVPNRDYSGPDSFTYFVTDRGDPDNCGATSITCAPIRGSAIRTVSFIVKPTNRPPAAETGQGVATNEDTPLPVTLRATDPDHDQLSFRIVSGPAHGQLSQLGPVTCGVFRCAVNITYAPTLNYSGSDSFTFQANDGHADSNIAVVSIIVNSVGKIAFSSTRDGNAEIYVMHDDGSHQTRLTDDPAFDDQPTWSPDGSKIAFRTNRDGGNYEIYVMNADGTDPVNLTHDGAVDQDPAWSPDGSQIAFASTRDGNFEIYAMNAADGSFVRRLTFNGGGLATSLDSQPAWSRDGSRIAFVTNRSGNADIWLMDGKGNNLRRLINDAALESGPGWAPGDLIAYTKFSGGSGSFPASPKIWVMRADGTNQHQVFDRLGGAADPAWSPDRARIACVVYEGGFLFSGGNIWLIDADGSNPIRLTTNPAEDLQPAWRP